MNILQMSAIAAILILVVVVIRALAMHRLPKKTFLVLWGVVLFQLLLPFNIPLPIGRFEVVDRAMEFMANGANGASTQAPTTGLMPEGTPSIGGGAWFFGAMPEDFTQAAPASPRQGFSIFGLWVAVMIGLALFFTITHMRCRKKYMSALPVENDFVSEWLQSLNLRRTVQVRYSDRLIAPMTYGIWKPVILLPKTTDWQDVAQLRYILTHELTHIKRFDILIKWLLVAAVCVHWFNPLVWVMYVLAVRDIELTCDETVVQNLGESTKSAYILALIGLEERRSGFAPLYNNFAKNAIEERINAIMKMKRRSIMSIALAFLLVSTVAVGALVVNAQTNGRNGGYYDNAPLVAYDGRIGYYEQADPSSAAGRWGDIDPSEQEIFYMGHDFDAEWPTEWFYPERPAELGFQSFPHDEIERENFTEFYFLHLDYEMFKLWMTERLEGYRASGNFSDYELNGIELAYLGALGAIRDGGYALVDPTAPTYQPVMVITDHAADPSVPIRGGSFRISNWDVLNAEATYLEIVNSIPTLTDEGVLNQRP